MQLNNLDLAIVLVAVTMLYTTWVLSKKSSKSVASRLSKLPRPEEVLEYDLGPAFRKVHKQLEQKMKTSAFPIYLDVGQHDGKSYASNEQITSIIAALLEREGWVVSKDDQCAPFEIIVDLPRKKVWEKDELTPMVR